MAMQQLQTGKALSQRSMFFFLGLLIVVFSLIALPWLPGSVLEYNFLILALTLTLGIAFMVLSYRYQGSQLLSKRGKA